MSTRQFRLSIGAKRQLTLPAELLQQLQVPERGELLVEVIGDHAMITPMVSMPRTQLPEELRRTFESRREAHSSDIPLAQFLGEVGYEAPDQKTAAAHGESLQERVSNLTPNETEALKVFLEGREWRPMRLTERGEQELEQITSGGSARQIAPAVGLAGSAAKANFPKRKAGKLKALEEARSTGG